MRQRLWIMLGLLILGTLFISLPLLGQATKPDFVLSGKYDGGKVYLKWTGLPGDSVRMNYIYRGISGTMTPVVRLDSTTKFEFVDQSPPKVALPLTYSVGALMKNGTFRSSNTVEVRPVESVIITSIPRETGAINTPYTYQVIAVSTDAGATLQYALSAKPERMTIDSARGLIQWTPTQRGFFKTSVVVTSSKGARAEQTFTITISGPAGTVSGLITDLLGKPVANVAVLLMPRTAALTPQYKGYTDPLGKYMVAGVDSGTYFARAIPTSGNFMEQWFDGVTVQERATPILVKPNITSTVNFVLGAKNDVVQITSRPLESAAPNVPYSYQVTATSSDPAAMLKYQLSVRPDGMNIDSVRGLISWLPAAKGSFKVAIVVVSSKGGRAEQSFGITVSGPGGSVAGSVRDTLNKPVAGVYIQLYQANGTQASDLKIISDAAGAFIFARVDSGKYFARAIPTRGDFGEQWYNGALTLDKATPVVVLPNTVTTVNFTLKVKAIPPQFSVSGTALDETKKVMREATVVFTSTMLTTVNPTSSIISPEAVYKVRADSTGKYAIKLPQSTYTVMATAPGFVTMFFDGKPDVLTATPLKLSRDTSGINFTLKSISSIATGKISGSVIDSATKAGLRSKVIAYRVQGAKIYLDGLGVYPAEADSTGKYTIANLLPGDYIVLALPLGPYAPTYYSLNGSTTNWERATKIGINGNSVTGITISAKPLVRRVPGYNSISGLVSISGMPGDGVQSGNAAGAIVYALLNPDDVAGFGITDETGKFFIEELAPGSYTLVVDKVNFVSGASAKANSVFNTVVGEASPSATASLTLSPLLLTAVEEKTSHPEEFVLEQNYPNPFNPSTAIKYQLAASSFVTLRVYDMLGRDVATVINRMETSGIHTAMWDGKDDRGESVASGIYLYQLRVGHSVMTRKMLLLR
ncbi:MAG: putative Ig domain-containing protein [Ignavibacteriales bacterium]|nr:putative Ig domain-containing protein [Ignavibacteriales bacterium]